MSLPNYDARLQPPDVPDRLDEADTTCLGWYPETATNDAFDCDQRTRCPMCDGVVCAEHDEVEDCDGEVVHYKCHKDGCYSAACAADRRDADLLDRAGL